MDRDEAPDSGEDEPIAAEPPGGDDDPISASGAINLGAAAFDDGQPAEARRLFAWALLHEPDNELGWLWFATVAEASAEQRFCLQRAVDLNPESPGLLRLALLPPGPATIPDDLIQLNAPPLPPGFAGPRGVLPLLPRSAIERRHRARHAQSGAGAAAEAGDDAVDRAEPSARARRWRWLGLVLLVAVIAAAAAVFWLRPLTAGTPYVIAFAGPLSGPDAAVGTEQLNAVRLLVAETNAAGGIGDRPVQVVSFDDQNDPARAASVAAAIVADETVSLVIGHDSSDASLAAAPVYAAAGLPAISAASSADALTLEFPAYFRVVMSNSQQGRYLALYANSLLGQTRASVISASGAYETTLAEAFAGEFARVGTVAGRWAIDPNDQAGSVARVAAELAALDDPGIVFLALTPGAGHEMMVALRQAGVAGLLMGGDALGYAGLLDRFAADPLEQLVPGAITDWTYVASPLIYDAVGGPTLDFVERYQAAYGESPEWFGAKAYDAATLARHALGTLAAPDGDAAARRAAALAALTALDRSQLALPGLTGPLYFDRHNTVPQVYSIGLFDSQALLSAADQYKIVTDPAQLNAVTQDADANVFELDGLLLRPYRVAYVGIDVNEISNLDPRAQTFDADFMLWLRYTGASDVEDVFFPNATNPTLSLGDPIDRSVVYGEQFAMFRVNATFSQPMDFHDYPWDRHTLALKVQNLVLTEDDLIYVPDQVNIAQSQADRLRSGTDFTQQFNQIPSWQATRVYYTNETVTARAATPSELTGNPEYVSASQYLTEMSFERDVRAFLIKNLLPLIILAVVTYISLFFSPENASTRIGFSITAILTSSVLLQSVSNGLPDIGYTVAIEWGYYAYLIMSAVLVLANIVVDRWYKGKRFAAVRTLDRIIRVTYPTIILLAVLAYLLYFRFR